MCRVHFLRLYKTFLSFLLAGSLVTLSMIKNRSVRIVVFVPVFFHALQMCYGHFQVPCSTSVYLLGLCTAPYVINHFDIVSFMPFLFRSMVLSGAVGLVSRNLLVVFSLSDVVFRGDGGHFYIFTIPLLSGFPLGNSPAGPRVKSSIWTLGNHTTCRLIPKLYYSVVADYFCSSWLPMYRSWLINFEEIWGNYLSLPLYNLPKRR